MQERDNEEAPDRVRIYFLADPTLLKRHESVVRRVIYAALEVSDASRFSVSVSNSGVISYVDERQLWRSNSPPTLPTNRAEAGQRAETFLNKLKSGFQSKVFGVPDALRSMLIIPETRRAQVSCVARAERSPWDHWLYRGQPQLNVAVGDTMKVDVVGSQIEVRIGEAGHVVGFSSRWPPLTKESISGDGTPFRSEGLGPNAKSMDAATTPRPSIGEPRTKMENTINRGEVDSQEHRLIYYAEGDGAPQYYLSPYYIVNEHDKFTLRPACKYSLVVYYNVVAGSQGETIITAIVDGGSGNYDFRWATSTFNALWSDLTLSEIGRGTLGELGLRNGRSIVTSSVTLEPGVDNVMVNVRDRVTGAFKHNQQTVYAFPILQEAVTSDLPSST